MPFADQGRLITSLLQEFGKAELGAVEAGKIIDLSIEVGVFAGQHDGPAGGTDRIADKAVAKNQPFPPDAIQMRRLNEATVIGTHGLEGVIIGHDEENVGAGVRFRGATG